MKVQSSIVTQGLPIFAMVVIIVLIILIAAKVLSGG
jgi:hypothetical protein